MSKFKITDLMVSLQSAKLNDNLCLHVSACHGHTIYCLHNTCNGITQICFRGGTLIPNFCFTHTCPGGSILCEFGTCGISEVTTWRETTIIQQYIPSLDIQELAELKVSLQGLVEKIDKEFRPAKLEQMDVLENELNEAIKDIKDQKKKFS